jgi:hypothetical protein
VSVADIPIQLRFEPCFGDGFGPYYCAVWPDDGSVLLDRTRDIWLDMIPFLAARALLEQRYNPARTLIVHLQGADFELMRAPLGAVAAKPLVNMQAPVKEPARCLFRAAEPTP